MEKTKKSAHVYFDVQDFSLQLRNSDLPKNAITNRITKGGHMNPICHKQSELPQVVASAPFWARVKSSAEAPGTLAPVRWFLAGDDYPKKHRNVKEGEVI